jgi:hypothetical protein
MERVEPYYRGCTLKQDNTEWKPGSKISSARWGNQEAAVKNQAGSEAWARFRPVDMKEPKRRQQSSGDKSTAGVS